MLRRLQLRPQVAGRAGVRSLSRRLRLLDGRMLSAQLLQGGIAVEQPGGQLCLRCQGPLVALPLSVQLIPVKQRAGWGPESV